MTDFVSNSFPGVRAKVESDERVVAWRGRFGQDQSATRTFVVDGDSRDAGNSPTTTLRAGLVMAVSQTDGRAYPYDPNATDGRQIPVGALESAVDLLENGVAVDRFAQILVGGLIRESALIGLDPRARQRLSRRFTFDREGFAGELSAPRGIVRRHGSVSVSASDSGCTFVAAAAGTYTLPAKQNGLMFRFVQTADANLTIVGSADLIVPGAASANSVACSTTNAKIGSQLRVECLHIGADTLRWVVTNEGGTALTVA